MYYYGKRGLQRDLNRAVKYYQMGADNGDPEGLYNLGISMLKVRYKGDMRMANMAGCSRAHDVTLEEFFQLTKFVNEVCMANSWVCMAEYSRSLTKTTIPDQWFVILLRLLVRTVQSNHSMPKKRERNVVVFYFEKDSYGWAVRTLSKHP